MITGVFTRVRFGNGACRRLSASRRDRRRPRAAVSARTAYLTSGSALRLVLACVAVLALARLAAAECSGPATASCIQTLNQCFTPGGACAVETRTQGRRTTVVFCFENGARIVANQRRDAQGATRSTRQVVRGAEGHLCSIGKPIEADGSAWRFRQGRRRWIRIDAADGSSDVTCPDGSHEHWAPGELAAANCFGSEPETCEFGTCAR